VCRTKKPFAELIRIARIDGKYIIDERGNGTTEGSKNCRQPILHGRGCHICPGCVEKAVKTRALNKSFKANVGEEIYTALAKKAEKV